MDNQHQPISGYRCQVAGPPECELYVPNVNRVKDIVDYRLRRPAPTPAFVALPSEIHSAFMRAVRASAKPARLVA